jgi:hypothetical protein
MAMLGLTMMPKDVPDCFLRGQRSVITTIPRRGAGAPFAISPTFAVAAKGHMLQLGVPGIRGKGLRLLTCISHLCIEVRTRPQIMPTESLRPGDLVTLHRRPGTLMSQKPDDQGSRV